ncbi:hypothetical protein ACFTAO_08940 [Paenibacillus rhizoplanae]
MLQMLSREVAVMSEQLQDELSAENAQVRLKQLEEAEALREVKTIFIRICHRFIPDLCLCQRDEELPGHGQ